MGSRPCSTCGHLFFAHGPQGCVTCGCTAVKGGFVRGDSPTAAQNLLAMLGLASDDLPNASDLSLGQLLEREGVPAVPSALYLSAGSDTMPFTFLSPAYVAHRGVDGFVMPELFVYVDQAHPRGARQAALAFADDRGTRIRTTQVDEISVGGHGAWTLSVEVDAEDPTAHSSVRVVRIRAKNQEVLPLVVETGWVPDVVITVCDGCRFGRQDEGRCENDLRDPTSIRGALAGPPKWWVTDHLRSLPDDWVFVRRTQLSSEWGHSTLGLFGASLFEVTSGPSSAGSC